MAPVPWRGELLQPLPQPGPHVDDPVRHGLDAVSPLLVQAGVLQHGVNNPAAMSRGVGVGGTNNQGHLGSKASLTNYISNFLTHILPKVCGKLFVFEDNSEIASPLIVQTKVLGK